MGVLSVFDGVFLAAVLYENERRGFVKRKHAAERCLCRESCVSPVDEGFEFHTAAKEIMG